MRPGEAVCSAEGRQTSDRASACGVRCSSFGAAGICKCRKPVLYFARAM